LTKSLSASQAS